MQQQIRPGRFSILPTVVKNLLIINGIIWLAQVTIGRDLVQIEENFALFHSKSVFYKPWQYLTYMFLHSPGQFSHLFMNMFGLWMFGSTLENYWGPKRFLTFYLICGVGAAFVHMVTLWYDMHAVEMLYQQGLISAEEFFGRLNVPTMGASGAVMGILAAFAYTFPNSELFVFPIPFPIKAKWAILGLLAIDLIGILSEKQTNIAHFAHLGGAAIGFLLVFFWNRSNRRTFY